MNARAQGGMTATAVDPIGIKLRKQFDGRLAGLKVNRYSWWVHWRELADYVLPRRYKWLITPNQAARGSPINQHIIDSTGTLAARNCAAGMLTGTTNPTKQWFRLKINKIDSTQTGPISLWLAECERLLRAIFQASNFYQAMATFYFDLVVFGTATILIYDDFENVINCYNPCAGEYFLDNSGNFRADVFYREFVLTVQQTVDRFGVENCSPSIARLYKEGNAMLTREVLIGHGIEPNDKRDLGYPEHFKYRELYWELGSSSDLYLQKKGYFENPLVPGRWDLVGNDAYGRSPAMDALGDIKQLQQETKRKAQAIDKTVNPPMVADIQLKNQPASLLPGGVTYVTGFSTSGKPGFASVYEMKFPVGEISEDLNEIRERIREIFFSKIFQAISQFETRSNVSATEIDARRAEAMLMAGPVVERIMNETLPQAIDRSFAIGSRKGIFPPPPPELGAGGQTIQIEFISMLAQAQEAASASGIERVFGVAGNVAGIDPAIMDVIDFDYGVMKYSSLLNNDPRLIRSPDAIAAIRQQREQQQQQQAMAQQADTAQKLAGGAETLSNINVGGGKNALQNLTGAS
jgi:hypothetical protein